MSYINENDIKLAEAQYGIPETRETTLAMPEHEFSMVKASQRHGRAHDITVFIAKGGHFIYNAKHWYPPGLFRAPSGAAKPGETLEQGCIREAWEETGCRIRLLKYLLRIRCRFICKQRHIDWLTHIFLAEYLEGDLHQIDTKEIREVHLVHPSEIPAIREAMRKSDSGGMQYRAYLTDEALAIINLGSRGSELGRR